MYKEITDDLIIKKCINNENTGWDILVEKYYKLIYNKIYHTLSILNCENLNQIVDDIYQEVFLKILKSFIKKVEIKNLKAWIVRISYTTTIDYLRKHFKEKKILSDEPVEEIKNLTNSKDIPDNHLLDKEKVEKISNALNTLSDKEQLILKLYYYHNMKYEEIGKIINTSTGSVGGLKSNAEKKLYKLLVEKENYVPDMTTIIVFLILYYFFSV